MKKIITSIFLVVGTIPSVWADNTATPSLQQMLAELSQQQQALGPEPPRMLSRTAEPPAPPPPPPPTQMQGANATLPANSGDPAAVPPGPMLAQANPAQQQIQTQVQQVPVAAQQALVPAQQGHIPHGRSHAQPVQTQVAAPQANAQPYPQEISGQQTAPQVIALPAESTSRISNQTAPLTPTLPASTQNMTPAQFQQWLQNNGYTKNQAQHAAQAAPSAVNSFQHASSPQAVSTFQPVARPSTSHHSSHRRAAHYRGPKMLSYEQGQKVMLNSVPRGHIPPIPDADVAFNMLLQQNMPLTPQQVVQLRQQIDVAQRAASTPPNIPPKPVSSTVMVNLAPGTTPPAIRLAQGYVSALVFVDSTSQPWPIAAFDIGNPKAVNIQWDGKSNILLLQAVSAYSDGDIVIRLVGNPTPITLELIAGQRVVDYRVDLHVPGIGPNTKEIPMGTALPNNPNQLLLGVLDGVSPAGSRTLSVQGADAQAWLLGEKLYLRTRLTLLSPGWVATMSSPDGMHAYELPKTSSVLVSRYGEPAELKIGGF